MNETTARRNPPPDTRGNWIQVVCPECVNANRHARRRCKRIGGMCKGTGYTWKTGTQKERTT